MTKMRVFTVLWVLCLVTVSCRGNPRVPATIQPPDGSATQDASAPGLQVGAPALTATALQETVSARIYPKPVAQVETPQGRLALAIPNASVRALKLHGSRLWGLTGGGLALWDLDNGDAVYYTPLNSSIDIPPAGSVVSPAGEWWSLDDDGVLVRMAALGQTAQRIAAFPPDARPLGPLAVDATGRVLALAGGDAQQKLRWMGYDTFSRKLGPVDHLDLPLVDSTGLSLAPDGSLWAIVYDRASGQQTLAHYEPAANTFQQIPLSPDIKSWASSLAAAADGSVWVGTQMSALTGSNPAGGLFRYDPAAGWQKVTPAEWPAGLDVYAATTAPDGSLWFGTRDGARRYDPNADRWEHFDPQGELAAGQVNAFLVDPQGSLWLGTSQGVRRYDPASGQWTRYDLEGVDLQDFLLFSAPGGKLWLFGSQGAVRRFDPASGQIVAANDAWAQTNPSGHVIQVVDEPGSISSWAAWNFAGAPGQPEDTSIHRYDHSSQGWGAIELLPDLEDGRPVWLASDSSSTTGDSASNRIGQAVWLLSEQVKDGRRVYRLWRSKPSGWNEVDLQRHLDGTMPVIDMVSGAQGSLWFARADGLHHFDPQQNTWTFHDVKASLGQAAVGRLKSTPEGGLWMRTAAGLAYYNPLAGLWRQYLIGPDVLPGDWDFLPLSDGSIWINHYPSDSLFKFTPGSPLTSLSGTPTPTPLLLWTPTPGITPSSTPTVPPQGWFGCRGSLPTRLYVGLTAKVVKEEFMVLKLRSTPAIKPDDSNLLDLLTGGTRIKIIGGPVCHTPPGGGAFIFWQIQVMGTDIEGWVVESIGPSYVIER